MRQTSRATASDKPGVRRPGINALTRLAPSGGHKAMTPDRRLRVRKAPIENRADLCEAYDYDRKVSFSRRMRVELDNYVMLFISGTASVSESGESIHIGDVEAIAIVPKDRSQQPSWVSRSRAQAEGQR